MNGAFLSLAPWVGGARAATPALPAAIVAFAAGGLALLSPAAALLALAVLAVRALIRAPATKLDLIGIAGPLMAALLVGAFVGLAGGIGVIFVWRLFADVRWSIREAQCAALAAGRPGETAGAAIAHAWLTPLYGLSIVAFTAPHMVAGLPLDLPHVPLWVPLLVGALAVGSLFDWGLRRAADWRLGELTPAPTLHLLAHHALFIAAYGCGLDVSAGLVAMIAWRLACAASARQASFTAVP